MDTILNRKQKKKRPERGLKKLSQDKHIDDLRKVKTFEFDCSEHTQQWVFAQIEAHRRKNPAFSLEDLLALISQKVTVFSENDIVIDHDELFIINGKVCAMAPDLKDLPEIDYDDPEVKKWLADQEAESIRKYGRMTREEAEYMYARRVMLQKTFPDKSAEELNKMALAEIRIEGVLK